MGAVVFLVALTSPQTLAGPPITMMIFGFIGGVASLVLVIIGLVRLTAPDPVATFRKEGFTARRLVRYCLVTMPVLMLGSFLTSLLLPLGTTVVATTLTAVVMILSSVVNTVMILAVLRYFAVLMRRVPRPGLVRFAKIEFWFVLVSMTLYSLGLVLVPVMAFGTAATFAAGPNMPASAFATGPNTPGTVTIASRPSGLPIFTSSATYSITTTAPSGAMTAPVTTMPATAPMVMPTTFGPLFFLAWFAMATGGCSLFGEVIAGLVLLILVQRALSKAAGAAI